MRVSTAVLTALPAPAAAEHTVSVNGHTLWKGPQFGGETDERFTGEMLRGGFIAVRYPLPKEYLENGCAELLIEEPRVGFEIAEFRITKAKEGETP